MAEKPFKQTDGQEGGYNKSASAKLGHVTRGEYWDKIAVVKHSKQI